MSLSLVHRGENAGGFHDVFRAAGRPRNFRGVHRRIYLCFLAVYDDGIVGIGNLAVKTALDAVIFEHIFHVVRADEGVVDSNNFHIRVFHRGTENQTTDSSESIDTYFNSHR